MKSLIISFFLFCLVLFSGNAQNNNNIDDIVFKSFFPAILTQKSLVSPEMEQYDVKSYILDIEVDNLSTNIIGNTTIISEVILNGLNEFYVELANHLSIDSILVDSELYTFTHEGDLIRIPFQNEQDIGTLLEVQVYYHGTVPQEGFFSGMTNKEDAGWSKWVTWTLSEPFAAKDWFPCKQDLLDKADSVKVSITTKEGLMAGSNGILMNVESLPGQKVRYNWETFYPTAYYLISISVADYMEYNLYAHPEGLEDSILIQNYIYNDNTYLNQKKHEIDETADLIELYSELFSMYPFDREKYGHCVAPMGGGMEHQTMTTLSSFTFFLVAHELGHMWFGDNVTCGTWQDIWINEGFASYTEYLALQHLRTQEDADNWMENAQGYAKDRPQGSVYIPFEEAGDIGRIFDYRLSYKKGAAIIHMLRFELDNDTVFFNTLKEFQSQFGDSVAIGLDFKQVLEDQSGMDFTDFFNQWYFGQGFPYFDIGWKQSNDTLFIESSQSASSSQTPLFKMPLELKVELADKDTLIRIFQTENVQDFKFRMEGVVSNIIVDPYKWSLFELNSISYIEDLSNQNIPFKVFPNPATDIITIDFFGKAAHRKIRILNLAGLMVRQCSTSESLINIDIQGLASGAYILQLSEDNLTWNYKLLKK